LAGLLGRQFPTLETMLTDAATELLAFTWFPVSHWKKIWSTNPWSGSTRRSSAAPTSSGLP
jgi:putative transposase